MFESVFLGCFVFGLLFTVASLAMGAAHGADGLHLHHGAEGSDAGIPWLAHFNLSAAMAFLMWFGGAGWLMLRYTALGLVAAAAVGLVAGAGVYALVASFFGLLRRSAVEARAEDYKLEGTVARVTVPVREGGVGEIVFTLQGVRRVEGARAATGQPLPKGTEVVITGFERGLAIVEDTRAYLQPSPLPTTLPGEQRVRPAETETER